MNIRPAAVAGLFYPALAHELTGMLAGWLDAIAASPPCPRALIVPHAGYVYSGPTAAHGFACLRDSEIEHVVLFGPAHRLAFAGMAVPECEAFATPLGTVPLNRDGIAEALQHPAGCRLDAAHAMEHSLEVQLPFLQYILPEFTLTPIVIGQIDDAPVAELMQRLWGDERTLMLISSDLSHYHPYAEARRLDEQTIARILSLDAPIDHAQACGATGINGLLRLARRNRLQPRLLDYRNSGDTAGDRQQVVGYTAIAFDTTEQHHAD